MKRVKWDNSIKDKDKTMPCQCQGCYICKMNTKECSIFGKWKCVECNKWRCAMCIQLSTLKCNYCRRIKICW